MYNGAAFLNQALDSVVKQSFRDFEVLLIDDASTDGSAALAESFSDPRVRMVRHERNLKLPATLNHGLDLAQGELIARMDADDVCAPYRFARQVEFLDAHPEIGICGCAVRLFGTGKSITRRYPVAAGAVEAFRFFHCPFAHPTVMLRRCLLVEHRLRYDPIAVAVEDFDLWIRLLRYTRGANLSDVLLEYRMHKASVTSRDWIAMNENSAKVLHSALQEILPGVTKEQSRFHRQVSMAEINPDIESLCKADEWLMRIAPLLIRNHDARAVLREIWFRLAMRVTPVLGFAALNRALNGSFPRQYGLDAGQRALIIGSAIKARLKGCR